MATVHYGRLVGTAGFAKTVAIKRLLRSLAQTDAFRKMILEEGRLAARIRHPNVVPPLDVLAEGGELLLVMEYVHGESLSRLLRAAWKAKERVPLPIGAAILSNVLHGLHAAHEARDETGRPLGIVHRDVSPQNVIVGADGIARVIDFGIAKAVTSEEMTTAGTIKGKVPYLAPEQLDGDPATRRTDLYAAGVVLWEVLANRRLFGGSDDGEVLRNIMSMKVEAPSSFNPVVPRAIDDVVLRAIARDPAARFDSAREMALAIEDAVHLATATVVGAWTERLAADTLAERAARIAEVEASGPVAAPISPALDETAVGPGTVRMSAAEAGVPGASPSRAPPLPPAARPARKSLPPPPAPRAPPPGAKASSPPMRPPMPSRPVMEPRTVIYEPPPLPEPAFVEGVRPLGADGPLQGIPALGPPMQGHAFQLPPPQGHPNQGAPASGRADQPSFPPPSSHAAARRITNVPKPTARGSAFKRFLRYVALFVVLALIVAFMFAPAIARALIVSSAAARGILVTIERVDVSRREIRLNDLRAESAEVPGATMRAGTFVIGLRWLAPDRITIDDVEISLDGSFPAIAARFDAYRAKHGAAFTESVSGIHRIEVTSGRIEWKNLIGGGTSALVENVTVEVAKVGARVLGDDYRLSAPLLTMKLANAPAGPWQLELDRQGILARSVIRFDPSGSYPASVTRTVGDDGTAQVSFAVPSTSLADLHLPAALLGGLASGKTRLEARGEIAIAATPKAASRTVSGNVSISATGLSLFPASAPVDVSVVLPLGGDAAKPIPIASVLAITPTDPNGAPMAAAATASMTGTLELARAAPRIVLAGKTGPIPCAKPGAGSVAGAPGPSPPAPRAAPPAGNTTGITATIDASLDDLPGAKISFIPVAACPPRLRP